MAGEGPVTSSARWNLRWGSWERTVLAGLLAGQFVKTHFSPGNLAGALALLIRGGNIKAV